MRFNRFSHIKLQAPATQFCTHHLTSLSLLLALMLNLAIAPWVLASTGGTIERGTAYALGLLGILVVGLVVYLFVVIVQPERF